MKELKDKLQELQAERASMLQDLTLHGEVSIAEAIYELDEDIEMAECYLKCEVWKQRDIANILKEAGI
jgi:hypothetical protein